MTEDDIRAVVRALKEAQAEAFTQLGRRVDALTATVDALAATVDALAGTVDRRMDAMERHLSDVEIGFVNTLRDGGRRIDRLEGRIEALEDR